jgi:phenylpropionate dioxygenase-like ring-hydroxylating dioxygenase large terminal subunit
MYLRNAWYVAAIGREVGQQPMARTIMEQPIVLYRQSDGTPVALEDRCCHRHAPLSIGMRSGDNIRCLYHGLVFDSSGACVEIPGQPEIPAAARVRAYPLVERYGWIWIWPGDPKLADPGLLPDWWWIEHPDWDTSWPDRMHVACNYELITANVLDVTHLVYVHANSIGNPAINDFQAVTEVSADKVKLTRWILDRPPPPMYKAAGGFKGNVDRWQIVEHRTPVYSVNFAGCAEVDNGAREGDLSKGIEMVTINIPTPETQRTTHYFFAFLRKFGRGNPLITRTFEVDFVKVFEEDRAVLEGQQRIMEALPGAPEISIKVDAAPMAARRMLQAAIAAENAAMAAE